MEMCGLNCIDIINLLIPVVIPLIVLFITLYSEKKKHKEQIHEIQEKNRIDAMPVFELGEVGFVHWETIEGPSLVMELAFKNIGNGVAIGIDVEGKLDDENWCVHPNDSTDLINIEKPLNQCHEYFELTIGFSDLYGNRYSQSIALVAAGFPETLKLHQKGIGIPKANRAAFDN